MLTIHTDNTISLNGKYIGRINVTKCGYEGGPAYTTFRTRGGSWAGSDTAKETEHRITEPTYVGGPSDWSINPKFAAQIKSIVRKIH